MGLGKWIVGGIAAAVAAPFVLPAATVAGIGAAVTGAAAAVGGAVATGAAAVGAGAAAVGTAVAGLGASALAAASAIGATTLIGGITIAAVAKVGAGLFAIALISDIAADNARTEGIKEGYGKASREYEKKLRDQAKEFFNQIAALKEEIEQYKLQRDKAQKLALQANKLLGKFEICISQTKEQGREVEDETAGMYIQLRDFTKKRAA